MAVLMPGRFRMVAALALILHGLPFRAAAEDGEIDPYGPVVDSAVFSDTAATSDTSAISGSTAAHAPGSDSAGTSAASAPATDTAASSGDGGAPGGGIELQEKSVRGRSTHTHRVKEVSRIRLGREELRKVAAAQGDPFKVLATLPGVSNQNDMSVRPFVRGGKAEETQVLWEGIPLLQPYHFASVYSIFNMEALEDMTLYSGGFPASVGNALSGAILMRSRPAPLDSFRLFADLSILRGLGDVGVPIVKDRLGASFSYQAFWYDWAIDRGWDALDFFAGDSAISAEKRKFRQYLDLPNFRDLQFGLNWKGGGGLSADYTGIVSSDVFTVRENRTRPYVNGAEVSPYYWEWNILYGNPADRREQLVSWDSLAVVSVDNQVHGLRFHWRPGTRWQVDQGVAWQSQDWHVSFFDQEIWTDSITPEGRFAGNRRPGPSELLFKLANRTVDWRLDARYDGDVHAIALGLSQSLRSAEYHTQIPKPIHDIIVHGSVDAMDGLGFFDPAGFAMMRSGNPLLNANVNYIDQLPRLIRFDFRGRQAGNFLAAYVTDEWSLDARHRLTLGLRAETDTYAGDVFLSPRAAFFKALGEKDELTFATGLYSQGDFPFHLRAVNPGLRSEKAFHANAEWTHAFSREYRMEVQAYQKNYFDLVITELENTGRIDWNSSMFDSEDSALFETLPPVVRARVVQELGERRVAYSNGGLGKAGGVEVSFFYHPNKVWNGWLSAETGYSRRLDRAGGAVYDFRHGRPWAFNWVNYFHMPSNYELSLRARFASGPPYTDFRTRDIGGGLGGAVSGDPIPDDSDTLFVVGPRNGRRYSPYSRWDIRLSKDFEFLGGEMQSYFEIWNSFNTPNFIMSDVRSGRWKFVDLNYPIPIVFLGLNYRW
jgi:hypothetical protein